MLARLTSSAIHSMYSARVVSPKLAPFAPCVGRLHVSFRTVTTYPVYVLISPLLWVQFVFEDLSKNGPSRRRWLHDHKRLGALRDCIGQRRVRRFVRKILAAGEESHEGRRRCVTWSRIVPRNIG